MCESHCEGESSQAHGHHPLFTDRIVPAHSRYWIGYGLVNFLGYDGGYYVDTAETTTIFALWECIVDDNLLFIPANKYDWQSESVNGWFAVPTVARFRLSYVSVDPRLISQLLMLNSDSSPMKVLLERR